MCSKQQLKHFLGEISNNAEFTVFNYVSSENYTILVKCQVENDRTPDFYSALATEWIEKFSKFTKTAWIVRRCFPRMKRLLYRKIYVCHFSSFNKKKVVGQTGARNKDCKAKIDFKMKFINRNTIKNDESLKHGLNLNIFIDFSHTHGIRAREYFNLLKSSPETDQLFYKYFASGHSVGTAKAYHELTLLSKHGSDIEECLSNSNINPSIRHIHYLHIKNRKGYNHHNIANMMAERMKFIEECGGVLRYTDDYSITVVITPFMKNVLTGHNLDCIMIDSTPIRECVVSFFFVPSPLGALPIACTLHSENTERSYSQAFFSTKLLIESQTYKNFDPNNIITNLIHEQNHALDAIFSNKKLCISRASMVEEIWKVICDIDSKIEPKCRHDLLASFHSLLHTDDVQQAEKKYKQLQSDKGVESTPKLQEYLNDIWNKREGFTSQTENKATDISIRTLKQFLHCRCNSFNSLIMMDVLLNVLDNHWCQILRTHLKGNLIMDTYTKFLVKDKTVIETFAGIKMAENEYKLITRYQSGKRANIKFRSDTLCCDCAKGRKGQLCEHLSAVLHFIELKTFLAEDKRTLYTAIASEDVEYDEIKLDPDADSDEQVITYRVEETISSDQTNEYYFIIKKETEVCSDPLDSYENEAMEIAEVPEVEGVPEFNSTENRDSDENNTTENADIFVNKSMGNSDIKKDYSVNKFKAKRDNSLNTSTDTKESSANKSMPKKDKSINHPIDKKDKTINKGMSDGDNSDKKDKGVNKCMVKRDISVNNSTDQKDKSINKFIVNRDESEGIEGKSVYKPVQVDVSNMKSSYENAMRALNNEFRRLNKLFKDNPSVSNLDTMGRLARELNKIRPVQKVNLCNLNVELNGPNMDCED